MHKCQQSIPQLQPFDACHANRKYHFARKHLSLTHNAVRAGRKKALQKIENCIFYYQREWQSLKKYDQPLAFVHRPCQGRRVLYLQLLGPFISQKECCINDQAKCSLSLEQ